MVSENFLMSISLSRVEKEKMAHEGHVPPDNWPIFLPLCILPTFTRVEEREKTQGGRGAWEDTGFKLYL